MVEQLCTDEFGSEGLADNEEISMEKSISISETRPKKADMNAFDYEAFYRKQGVYDSPQQQLAIVERQMTTEDYEQELADHFPVELSKRNEISKKQLPPDLSNREAFYERLGIDLSEEKNSERPTEKKSYVLPVLEPMMSTWTYQAMKFEEQASIDSQKD